MFEKMDKTNVLLTMVTLILVVCNLSLGINKFLSPIAQNDEYRKQYEANRQQQEQEEQNALQDDEMSQEDIDKEQLTNLKSMGEEDRMYTYFYQYITMIESGKYEEAYNTLYEDFKTQYFPTIEDYKNYVQGRYPTFISVKYNGIERQGEYYILTVLISSDIPSESGTTLQQKFILHEKDFNDFELSFQVI